MKVNASCLYFKGKPNQMHEFRKEKYKNEPIAFWQNIPFTDKSKFEIFNVKNHQKYGEVLMKSLTTSAYLKP